MKQLSNNFYKADEGCFIIRKSDNFIMGESIDLGSSDSIDNYTDTPYTEESYKEFYESIGMTIPERSKKTHYKEKMQIL